MEGEILAIVSECEFIAVIESSKRYVFIIDCFCKSKKMNPKLFTNIADILNTL